MVNPTGDFPDWMRGILLMGVDASGNPVGVLVDSDGNLNAILKGQGATGLQTIAVDAAGRIEVFILDAQSQWGDVLRIGNAELASRLGSPKSWDWRGDVVYHNDFSRGMGNILQYANGTGAAIALSPLYWVNGGYSLKLTGGSTAPGTAYIDVLIDHPPSGRMGLECHFSGDTDIDYVQLLLFPHVGSQTYYAGLMVTMDGVPDVSFQNSTGAWEDIGVSYFGTVPESFNHFKIVADFDTGYYLRALWGHTQYDLSAEAMYHAYGGYLDQVYARFLIHSTLGNNESRYLDYITVTVNEPDNA